jgi:glutamate N-acetyltransferase/amino-acid N-acetyltransferase
MNRLKKVPGGVVAPRGFQCGAAACGIKNGQPTRDDLAIIASDTPCHAAATLTTNVVKAAPVLVSMEHLAAGRPRAVVMNSGNANACTAVTGLNDARSMAAATAQKLAIRAEDVLVCSTGRIGVRLPIQRILAGIESVVLGRTASEACARAIMTSDTFPKEVSFSVKSASGTFRIGGIAKGAGMINPNMATMLCVVTCDAIVSPAVMKRLVPGVVGESFNRITVDGDTSTNDTVVVLANGASGVKPTAAEFRAALHEVSTELARMIAFDGEGVSRFVELTVRGAESPEDARRAAEAVANSTLVKCAWAGGDPNWGRILCALGYSGASMIPEKTSVSYDDVPVVIDGQAARTSWSRLRKIAAQRHFRVAVDLNLGKASHLVWTTDLTEDYVRLNLGE